jgi:predicted alpha-1,6-mannanase (GH76 family)
LYYASKAKTCCKIHRRKESVSQKVTRHKVIGQKDNEEGLDQPGLAKGIFTLTKPATTYSLTRFRCAQKSGRTKPAIKYGIPYRQF